MSNSGQDPIGRRPGPADPCHVMTFALRYSPLGRRFPRSGTDAGTDRVGVMTRARVRGPVKEEKADARMEHVQMIRDQIVRDDYQVNPSAVAEALLTRLLQGRTLK